MNIQEVMPLFARMFFAFLAAFPAIALWSKARDAAWLFVVLGALFMFVDALYAVLVLVGVASYSLPFAAGIPLLKSVLGALPSVCMALGFVVFLYRVRRY